MRLINADALLEVLNSKEIINLRHVIDLITNAPTVQREGWVSVPIEPTDEMVKATFKNFTNSSSNVKLLNSRASIYKAMISAAPKE
jgi:predicted metal-dependent TIM-barrel fold hydrolase